MGVSYSPKISTNGLFLYFDSANTKSYPGSGSTWFDLSGSNNNGTLLSSPTISQNYFSFDGSDKRTTIIASSPVSVSVWYARVDSESATNWRSIFAASTNFHHLILQSGTNVMGIWDGTFKSFAYTPPNDSVFRNYTVTYRNGIDATLYINGEFHSTISTTLDLVTTPIANIGNWTGTYWAGRINLPMLYNKTLSITEIKQNFNATRTRYGV